MECSNVRQFFFNAWSLILLWFIGGVYIPREYFSKRFQNIKHFLGLPRTTYTFSDITASQMKKRVVVITGGSRGIGLAAVRKMLAMDMTIMIGSSAPDNKRRSLECSLRLEFPEAEVSVWHLNLNKMESVQDFAEQFVSTGLPLHVLINNAGIMFEPKAVTEDGFESHMAVNYFGHCLLMNLLLPCLKKTGCQNQASPNRSRVVNVTSCVAAVGYIRLHDLQSQQLYSPYQAYMQSKLAQLIFTYALQLNLASKQYEIDAISVHPGVVDTGLHHQVWWAPKAINRLYRTPDEGADCLLHAALSPQLEKCELGLYIEDFNLVKSWRSSYNKQLQDQLWNQTWETLKPWLPKHCSQWE